MARQAPEGLCHQGPFSGNPLDTGPMPKKILRRSRNPRNNLPLRTLQSDEPKVFSARHT